MNRLGKDRDPFDTIALSVNFLLENRLLTTEKWTSNSFGLYSVNLQIAGTGFSVNGKGISKVAALASAHGELQERLLNKAFFRINSTIYYEKEQKDCLVDKETIIDSLHVVFPEMMDYERAYDLILQCSNGRQPLCDVFIGENRKEFILPSIATDIIYGTNGMCAGNSKEESIIQGVSEIIERYVSRVLFKERIHVPSFDFKKLDNCRYIESIISKLKTFGIEVLIKDLSLGFNLPAVGVVFYNVKTLQFFFKIGVHPNLNLAIERCFTEFAQGKTDEGALELVDYVSWFCTNENRLQKYFKDGHAAVPIDLLSDSNQGTLENKMFNTNKEYLDYMLSIIKDMGYSIYFIDNSSEAFRAYRIVIPGMSEILTAGEFESQLMAFHCTHNIPNTLKKESLSLEDIESVKGIITKEGKLFEELSLKYPSINVKRDGRSVPCFKWYEIINLEYLRIGEVEKSFEFLVSLHEEIKKNPYYLCLLTLESFVLEKKIEKEDYKRFKDQTECFFSGFMLDWAFSLLNSPDEVYSISFDKNDNYFYRQQSRLYDIATQTR